MKDIQTLCFRSFHTLCSLPKSKNNHVSYGPKPSRTSQKFTYTGWLSFPQHHSFEPFEAFGLIPHVHSRAEPKQTRGPPGRCVRFPGANPPWGMRCEVSLHRLPCSTLREVSPCLDNLVRTCFDKTSVSLSIHPSLGSVNCQRSLPGNAYGIPCRCICWSKMREHIT